MKHTVIFFTLLFSSKAYCLYYCSYEFFTNLLSQIKTFFIIFLIAGSESNVLHNKFGRPVLTSLEVEPGKLEPIFSIPENELPNYRKIIDYSCNHRTVIKAPNEEAENFLLNHNNKYDEREVGVCTMIPSKNQLPECKRGQKKIKLSTPLDSDPDHFCLSVPYSAARKAIQQLDRQHWTKKTKHDEL